MSQTRNSARPVSRPGQHPPFQFGILLRGEPGGATGDLAIAQPGNAFGIVSLHRPGQIPRRQANQFRRFLTAAPVQDVGNAKQATHHLPGLLQPSQQPQTLRVAVLPHRDHRRSPPSDVSLRARHPKMLTQETTDLSRDPYNSPTREIESVFRLAARRTGFSARVPQLESAPVSEKRVALNRSPCRQGYGY